MHTYYPFTEALIRTMAKQQLAAAQWPDDLALRYSLNACQGDGVSFTGTLSTADLLRLIPVLQARGLLSDDVTSTLQLFIPLHHATVQLVCRRHNYSHSGTVELVAHDIPEGLEAAESMLLEALNREFEEICARTEVRGYRIIAATHPEERGEMLLVRRTANIELRAVVAEPCALGYCDDDEETLREYLALIEDGARVPGIEMQVWCNGQRMAQSWIEHVVIHPGAPARAWLHREEIAYIAGEAREMIREQAEAFRSFLRRAA
ncbi:hypothetical protein ELZ88_24130 (plasmid) [Salmonella enterica subsp. enterica serovar Karamoja]|uniref:Uncharacterized protein n=1 Tax=Salmonella enterica subsp. enterica serovar Karamoja TaxID=2500153 RepID=A0A3Q9MLK2_SALET|nr:hypothetical protein [Salmonella enterica]AZT39636.1 hypothetical protein ELZ88_24130 [Salmonella enterica subsp. enterica serovar Karamoja]AZT44470.1 hypothetical protein EL007_24815 [Salmonella enterica subsp. enterica serovar Karamoja]